VFREGPAPAPSQAPVLGSKLFITTDTALGMGTNSFIAGQIRADGFSCQTYKQVLAITKMNQVKNKDRNNYFHSFSMENSCLMGIGKS
jgi:hypothetical protein